MSYVPLNAVSVGSTVRLKEGGKVYTFVRVEPNEDGIDQAILRVEGSSGREYAQPLTKQVLIASGAALGTPAPKATAPAPKKEHPATPPLPVDLSLIGVVKVKNLSKGHIFRWPTTFNIFEVMDREGDEFKVEFLYKGTTTTTAEVGTVLEWSGPPETDVELLVHKTAVPEIPVTPPAPSVEVDAPAGVEATAADLREGDEFIVAGGGDRYLVEEDRSSEGVLRFNVMNLGSKRPVKDWKPTGDQYVKILSRKADAPPKPAPAPAPPKSAPTPKPATKEADDPMSKMSVLDYVKSQGISGRMIQQVNEYRKTLGISSEHQDHPKLRSFYFGATQLKLALAALLGGQHLILKGPKGSGKNTLAETAAFLLATPLAEIQGHAHLDGDAIIGHEVFKSHVRDAKDMVEAYESLKADGLSEQAIGGILAALGKRDEVTYLYGTVAAAARDGKFVVIDEANSVRPEALIITHSLRDDRRRLEIPGYGVVTAHPRFRMILTFNPGYAGTSELNEATADGFVPVYVPPMGSSDFTNLLITKFHKYGLKNDKASLLSGIFQDLLKKSGAVGGAAEISSRPVSVRAVLQAVELMWQGIPPQEACLTSFVGRTDEELEQKIVGDVIRTRIQAAWGFGDFFKEA